MDLGDRGKVFESRRSGRRSEAMPGEVEPWSAADLRPLSLGRLR